jgi:hypothetical protein
LLVHGYQAGRRLRRPYKSVIFIGYWYHTNPHSKGRKGGLHCEATHPRIVLLSLFSFFVLVLVLRSLSSFSFSFALSGIARRRKNKEKE